jgi:3-phosphoshikimate 1-carboxyvinyltransferase
LSADLDRPPAPAASNKKGWIRIERPQPVSGQRTLRAHPDKAISQRATLLAAVAEGESTLTNLAGGEDLRRNLRVLDRLGVPISFRPDGRCAVAGRDCRTIAYEGPPLDCGNSATTSRILMALLAGSRASCSITGNASLRRRPMAWVVDPLRRMGAQIRYSSAEGHLPVALEGRRLAGGVHDVAVDSAQAVSALCFAALSAEGPVVIRRRTRGRDHTERLLRFCGVPVEEDGLTLTVEPSRPRAFQLSVPGDPSAAAFLCALHLALPATGGWLGIEEVCLNPRRLGFFRIAAEMGAEVAVEPAASAGPEEVGTLRVRRSGPLEGVLIRGAELVQSAIDELPLVAALATAARGPTVIADAEELRDKDTDRIAGTATLLAAFGARAEPTQDGLAITPSPLRSPDRPLRLPPDHRLVFAAITLALLAGGQVTLDGIGYAAISNPNYLADISHFASVTQVSETEGR